MFDFGTDTNLANTLFIGVPPAPTDGQGAYPLMPTLTNVNPRVRRSPGSTLSIRSEGGSVSRRRAVYGDMYADGLATQYASSTAHLDNRDKKKTEKQPSRSYRARSVSLHAQQAQQAQSASAVRDSYLQTKLAAQNAEKAGNAGKEKAGKGEKDKAAKDKGKDKAGERSKQENGFLSVHGLLSSQSVQSVQSVHSAQSGNTMQSLHSALGPPVTKPLGTSAPPSSYVAPNLASHPQRPAPPVRSASTTDVPTKAGLAPASAATIAAAAAAAPSASACKPESDRTPALPSLAEIASLKSLLPHSQLRAGVVTPTGSDDEWEGEKPSRSYAAYVRKPASVCAPIHRAPVAKPSSRPASVHPVTRRRATSNVDYRPPPAPAPAPVALPLPHQLSAIPQPRDRGLARYAFSDVGGLSRPPSVVRFDFGREARYVPTLSYAGTGGPPTPSAGSAPVAAGPQKPEACPSFLGSLLGLRRRSSSTKEDLKPMTAPKPPPKPQQAQAQASPVQPRTTSQFKRGDLASLEAGILPFAFAGVPPPAQAAPPLPPKTAGRAMSIRNLKAALGDLNLPGGQRQRGARNVADDDDDSGANTPTALHGAMPYSDSIIPEGPEDILAPDITIPIGQRLPLARLDTTKAQSGANGAPSMGAIALSSRFRTARERRDSPKDSKGLLVDYTTHMTPPTRVGRMQVLVQVYAVGVDAHDIAALDNQGIFDIGKYVPGRSFVGRAVSLGEDESDLRPGDLVMGLMDVRKSGALSEYVLVDRRRVARAPDSSLTLEQLALLPAQGVTALRALHNLPLRVGMRALVMDATAGGAALISQELARLGVAVTAVISGNDETSRVLAHAQCVAYGARAVFLGSPTAVMRRMDEGAFDIVVDTRGGPKIFEAARRILAEGGYLLSLAADGSTRRPKNTGGGRFRAFRRSRINTAFIVPAGMGEPTVDTSGLDPRDIMECPAMANLVPTPTTVVPFERGPEVFARRQGGVVRIVQ